MHASGGMYNVAMVVEGRGRSIWMATMDNSAKFSVRGGEIGMTE